MTGDVTINPSASALVMTTEVRERSQNFVMLCLWAPTYLVVCDLTFYI